ncbi:MAG: NifU family protein [bacterium]|nr:NifU family protein [bacterium]
MDGSVLAEGAAPGGGSAVDLEALHEAVDFLRPALHADGGDLVLLDVDSDGVVAVELMGACGTCPLSVVTLTAGIEALFMQRVPGVTGVVARTPTVELPGVDDQTA